MKTVPARDYSPEFTIRRAGHADNLDCVFLVTEVLGEYGITPDLDDYEAHFGRIGLFLDGTIKEFVAVANDIVVGVAIVSKLDRDAAFLADIYVRSLARGKGVGKALMKAVVECARDNGCSKITLETRERFIEAINLYNKTGWKKEKTYKDNSGPEMVYVLDVRGAP